MPGRLCISRLDTFVPPRAVHTSRIWHARGAYIANMACAQRREQPAYGLFTGAHFETPESGLQDRFSQDLHFGILSTDARSQSEKPFCGLYFVALSWRND